MIDDPMAEVRRLAETLRQSLATLDEQIEQRAREIVAEHRPASVSKAMQEALDKVEVVGEMMRQHMLDRAAEGEGKDFLAAIQSVTWKSSAARLLLEICENEYKEQKRERVDG